MASIAALLLGCGGDKTDAEAASVVPCGGDLVNVWSEVAHDLEYPPNPSTNACWNLQGTFSAEGYSANSRYPTPKARATLLRFAEGGTYYGVVVRFGPVTVNYAAECLVTDQGTPTCTQLQEALRISGAGEGWYQGATCADRSGGGCSCTVQVHEVGGPAGMWALDASGKKVTLTKPMGYPEPLAPTVGYCVKNGALRFSDPIDGGSYPSNAYTAHVTFTPPDCAGTPQRLSAEYGSACSVLCGQAACGEAP